MDRDAATGSGESALRPGTPPTPGPHRSLVQARFVGFIPVRNLAAARSFYVDVLGLTLHGNDGFAVTVDTGGVSLRLTEVADHRPQPFTIAGWEVVGIRATMAVLAAAGVLFAHHDGLEQDPHGVWTTPSGDLVAWFTDPEGNTLSLTERGRR